LIELVVTTALLAILIQVAIPEMSGLLAAWQRDRATRSITDHLALARSEAIRWSRRVVMCSSPDGRSCAPGATKDWRSGWIVFQDLNVDGQFDASDKLIAISQGPDGVRDIRGNALIQRFVFRPNGMMSSGMSTLEIVPKVGAIQKITVNRIGRVRLSTSEDN
jgi:type IV fimbrial biogenesis protein FimT